MSCSYKYRKLLVENKEYGTPDWAKKLLKDHQLKIKNDFNAAVPPTKLLSNKRNINKNENY